MDKLILIVLMIPISAGTLPENVHRLNSCPEAKNKTAWEEASKRLKCNFHKNSFYHCLPSTYLNETIEFCGKLTAVSEGHCPIYNYEMVLRLQLVKIVQTSLTDVRTRRTRQIFLFTAIPFIYILLVWK